MVNSAEADLTGFVLNVQPDSRFRSQLVAIPKEIFAGDWFVKKVTVAQGAVTVEIPLTEFRLNPDTDRYELDLVDLLPKDRDVYALRVRGDSMVDDGVHDGDIVLVERREQARDGEMVVAVLPDEQATLKRIYKEGTRWRLQPSHPTLAPIYTDEVEVRGRVIGVVRRF